MSIRSRLQLVFRRADVEAQPADDPTVPSAPTTDLEVVVYAEDCRLFGHLALSAARLTDMLNEADEVELVDVAVEALSDGRIVEMRSMVVRRDELLVVQATGPRGARERRQRTRPHPVAVKIGPYIVRGQLHALPTADPFVAFRRRPPMVPLTDGSISYAAGGATIVRCADTIIVNRAVVDWVAPATEEPVESPGLPTLPTAKGILLKDFTGEIHPVPHDDLLPMPVAVVTAVEPAATVPLDEALDDTPAPDTEAAPPGEGSSEADPPPAIPVRRPRKALKRAG